MPWNEKDYPVSMKNMKKVVRDKAIEIANALKEEKYSDQRAISIATEQAEKWYQHRSDLKDDTPFKKNLRRHS